MLTDAKEASKSRDSELDADADEDEVKGRPSLCGMLGEIGYG
jgi:hypothetical protein